MIANSISPATEENELFTEALANENETNSQWLERIQKENGYPASGLLLIGGNSVAHFRIRAAQSHLRLDLTPSCWSMVGILSGGEEFLSVPLNWTDRLSEMPRTNGILSCKLSDYDDPVRYPNFAVVHFTSDDESILGYAERLQKQRSVIDLPALVISWLEYVWAVGKKGNPLIEGHGLPSAVFAETVFGIGGIELTPGLSAASSCPEAMWQAAKWWAGFYEQATRIGSESQSDSVVPHGRFVVRQPAAAVYCPPDE